MTTITDILYQKYVSNQNEPVCMSKDYFNKPSYFNISFINFQKAPNKLMYILSTSFIHRLLNTKTTYRNEKFIYLKSILDNPFLTPNQKTEFLSIFQDIQHINNSLCKFVWKYLGDFHWLRISAIPQDGGHFEQLSYFAILAQ